MLERFAEKAERRPAFQQLVDVPAIIEHLSSSLRRELDFRNEAANIERMRSVLARFDQLDAPCVYTDLSTARLLVMQEVQGIPVREAPEREERRAAGRDGARRSTMYWLLSGTHESHLLLSRTTSSRMAEVSFTDEAIADLRRLGPDVVPKVLKKVLLLEGNPEAGYPPAPVHHAPTSADEWRPPVFLQRGSTLAVSAQRRTLAATFGVVTLTLATALMLRIEPRIELSSVLLVYLTLTVVTAAIGGGFVAIPAGVAAVAVVPAERRLQLHVDSLTRLVPLELGLP
jgi:hypothetical protein